jgi:hypothetical protein
VEKRHLEAQGGQQKERRSRPAAAICAYCVQPIEGKADREHVFPESWYPDGTDPTFQRPKVPSCHRCNRDFGKIEQSLLRTWGICLPKETDANRGISARAVRSLNPWEAKGPRDAYFRERTRDAFISSSFLAKPDVAGKFPGLDANRIGWGQTASGIWIRGPRAIPIRGEDVTVFTKKLVRGLFYILSGDKPLPADANITDLVLSKKFWPNCAQIIHQSQIRQFGVPGFYFWPMSDLEDPYQTLWFFLIWDFIFFQAITFGPGENLMTALAKLSPGA